MSKKSPAEIMRRNLNPHKEAIAAMTIWGAEYSKSGVGSMDFFDQLADGRQRVCRDLIDRLETTPKRARTPRYKPILCIHCGIEIADSPAGVCPGCDAYRG